jgi:hypothetical protein
MTTHRPKNSNVNNLRVSCIAFQLSVNGDHCIPIEKVKSRATNKRKA